MNTVGSPRFSQNNGCIMSPMTYYGAANILPFISATKSGIKQAKLSILLLFDTHKTAKNKTRYNVAECYIYMRETA